MTEFGLGEFARETLFERPDGRIPISDLFDGYVDWCERLEIEPTLRRNFVRRLSAYVRFEAKVAKINGHPFRCVVGVEWKLPVEGVA